MRVCVNAVSVGVCTMPWMKGSGGKLATIAGTVLCWLL